MAISEEKKSNTEKPLKVLIVDKDRDLGALLTDVLKNFGFTPVFAANATNAANEIKMHPDIDIILVDWMLQDMQGEKVIKNLIRIGATCPIIVMSAKKAKEDVIKAIKSGAKYYIVKPLNIGQLVLKINAIAGRNAEPKKIEEFSDEESESALNFDAYIPITILDVSKTGCAFQAPTPIPLNSVVFLEMSGLALKMELPKFTSFSIRIANCNEENSKYRIGSQFVGLPENVTINLAKLCESQPQTEGVNKSKKRSKPLFTQNGLAEKINVLIIDDGKEDAEVMQNMLALDGYNVITALSAEEGMRKLESNPAIDIILLDWIMPDVSGIDFLEKTNKKLPLTPVIMVTGKTGKEAIRQALEAGVADYHSKPVDAKKLNKSIKNVLHRHTEEDVENAPVRKTMIQEAFISISIKYISGADFIISSSFKIEHGHNFFLYSEELNQHLDVGRQKKFAIKSISCEGNGNNYEIIAKALGNFPEKS